MAKAANASRYYGTGRRKKSIARVYLVPGTGNITINKRTIDEYFGLETLKVIVRQPLVATDNADKFDVKVTVRGGGTTGQAGAIRHGIARALLTVDNDFRPVLKGVTGVMATSVVSPVHVTSPITRSWVLGPPQAMSAKAAAEQITVFLIIFQDLDYYSSGMAGSS